MNKMIITILGICAMAGLLHAMEQKDQKDIVQMQIMYEDQVVDTCMLQCASDILPLLQRQTVGEFPLAPVKSWLNNEDTRHFVEQWEKDLRNITTWYTTAAAKEIVLPDIMIEELSQCADKKVEKITEANVSISKIATCSYELRWLVGTTAAAQERGSALHLRQWIKEFNNLNNLNRFFEAPEITGKWTERIAKGLLQCSWLNETSGQYKSIIELMHDNTKGKIYERILNRYATDPQATVVLPLLDPYKNQKPMSALPVFSAPNKAAASNEQRRRTIMLSSLTLITALAVILDGNK